MRPLLSIQWVIIWLACFCVDISIADYGVGTGGTNGDGLAVGLGVGLGVGLPFICGQALNFAMLKSVMKDLFGSSVELSKNVVQDKKFDNYQQISCPDDLYCDFNNGSNSKALCAWENNRKDRPCKDDFFPVLGDPKKLGRWQNVMGNKNLPDGGYFVFASRKSGYPVSMLSKVIPSQEKDGILEMKYWISSPATLQVCLLFEESNYTDLKKCSAVVKNSKKHIVQFKIGGPIKSNFKIMIQASNFIAKQGSVVIIDDIQYHSDLCDSFEELKACKPSECISFG